MRHRAGSLMLPLLLLVSGSGCRSEQQRPTDTTALAPPGQTRPPVESTTTRLQRGGLATRTEAQEHFERALAAFDRKDAAQMAVALRAAAGDLRRSVAGEAAALTARAVTSAADLDTLAAEVERGGIGAKARLLRVMVRANRAEAARHQARAATAWAARDTVRSGEELLMATDHLERAITDAGASVRSAMRDLEQARTLANDLMRRQVADTGRVGKVIEAVRRRVERPDGTARTEER